MLTGNDMCELNLSSGFQGCPRHCTRAKSQSANNVPAIL